MEENFINSENNFDTEILNNNLSDKIKRIPTKPGIYQYFNSDGKIIYVGKAKNLRNRVKSYFQNNRPRDAKTTALVKKIFDMEFIATDSEAEALILEDTLIKKHRPRYNILLKDDKSYPYIRVTNEDYPRVFATRKVIKDGSKYYGPYSEVRQMKHLLKTIRTIFKLRSCDLNINDESIDKKKHRLCLDYHIKKCEGPCEGLVQKEIYKENIKHAVSIINGKTSEVEKSLLKRMEILSEDLRFEEALILKNQYLTFKEYLSSQKIVTTDLIDRDVFGISNIQDAFCTLIFKIRDGKMIGKRHFIITNAKGESSSQILEKSIEKWYLENDFIPDEIFIPCPIEDQDFIKDWLKEKKGKSCDIIEPKLGDKKKLVNMASMNAEYMLKDYFLAIAKKDMIVPKPILSLQRDLRMDAIPRRIECYDNSQLQGTELVSSMVVFIDGKPKKSEYRKYKIKSVDYNNDFAAMKEVIYRRFKRAIDENQDLPELVVIDGGKGQLSAAMESINELNLAGKFHIIGLAKRLEEIFVPGKSDSMLLPKTSSSLKVIQQIRDEAHRFAITFHRLLRDKRTLKTELTEIKGIGETLSKKLLIKFGSVDGVMKATEEELTNEIGSKSANLILDYFKNKENEEYDKF
jgi:excinuclease ABC subunit C